MLGCVQIIARRLLLPLPLTYRYLPVPLPISLPLPRPEPILPVTVTYDHCSGIGNRVLSQEVIPLPNP